MCFLFVIINQNTSTAKQVPPSQKKVYHKIDNIACLASGFGDRNNSAHGIKLTELDTKSNIFIFISLFLNRFQITYK